VIVVGDSYMQGLLLGDDQTPPAALERALGRRLGLRVAVLNTGLLGYSPEQYYHTLRAAVAVFPADFVVVTAFANDVGNEDRALRGEGDWAEAGHWLQELQQLCRQRRLPYLVTAVVCEEQFVGRRRGVGYPASLVEAALVPTQSYLDPIETFLNHDLAARGRLAAGSPSGRWQSPLFNQRLGDGHFSAEGAELWAEVVSERVVALLPNRFRSRTKETQASLPETSFQSGP
jgi:lysophospholipase L1-like esterase